MLETDCQLEAKAVEADRKEKGIQRVVVKPPSRIAGMGASNSGVSKSGAPKIGRQAKKKLVDVSRNDKVVGQHNFCAILGTPIAVPKIEHQAEIGAVEQKWAVKAEVQHKCGDILGAPVGGPKI